MLDVLTLMTRVLLSPLWGLWWVYRFLWWTFSPDPLPAATPSHDAKSFDIVDSRPIPKALPMGALRGGFIGSVAASGGLAMLASTAARNDIVQPASALALWGWTSVLVLVLSIFAVRTVVLRRDLKASQRRGVAHAAKGVARGAAKVAKAAAITFAIQGDEDHPSRLRRTMTACASLGGKGWHLARAGCRHAASTCRNAASGARSLASTLQNPVRSAPATSPGPHA